MGYKNRSKAISDAIARFVAESKLQRDGECVGTISFFYDHHIHGIESALTDIQHGFDCITSSMHAHVSHSKCVEVLIVKGRCSKLRKLADAISATRGVENCSLSVLD